MKRMLFNATQSEELRVAIVDGQKLIDLDIEHAGKEQRKSNIYKGVITRIEPSLEAAFVDYGSERHGFLPFKEISRSYFSDKKTEKGSRPKIQDVIKEGQEVIVQVDKDERGSKGAALTTFISLAGRYLVLMPNNPRGGGVSRRVEGEERNELRETMSQLEMPKGMSIIARTAGIGRTAEELQWDLNYLTQLWKAIEEAAELQPGAYLIYQEGSLVIRAIRDYFSADIGEILIDTPVVHEQAIQFMDHVMPSNVSRVKLYEDETPLFSRFQIEHQIESAFSREVRLPSGGAIVIDHTEALVSIDVNSGRSIKGADIEQTAFNTNLEAAEEVARQMRLRDLGGLVVIDFIDMEVAKHQREVENAIKDALHYDRARVQTSKISRFGLMELSRQRLRPSIGESNHVTCPRCNGTGHIRGIESTALHILRITQEEAMKEQSAIIQVQLPVEAATFLLNEKRADIHKVEELTGVEVVLIPNIHMETPNYNVSRIKHDDVNEDSTQVSYKMVDQPAETEYVQKMNEAPPAKPEAVVKGVTTATSAPVVDKPVERASIFGKVKAWLGFSAEEEKAAEPAKKESKSRNNNKRNNQNRNQRNRNRNRNNDKQDRKSADNKSQQDKNNNQKNQPNDKQAKQGRGNDENKETRQERGPRRNRRNRRDRRPREEQSTEQKLDQATQQKNTEAKVENSPAETQAKADNNSAKATPAKKAAPKKEAVQKESVEKANDTVDTKVEAEKTSASDIKEAKPAAKKTRAPRKTTTAKKKEPAKAEDKIDLVETKPASTSNADKAESAEKPAPKKKPATRKPRATKSAAKKADTADAGIELVETKATPAKTTKAKTTKSTTAKKTTKAKATKEASWQKPKEGSKTDNGDALVMVETQKKD